MNKFFNYLIFVIFALTAYGLFAIKDKVSTLNSHINEIVRQIKDERNAIHIMKAEVAYLSSPNTLRELVDSHFELKNIKTTQMIKDPLINQENSDVSKNELLTADMIVSKKVKWRYKKRQDKYLKTVSNRR